MQPVHTAQYQIWSQVVTRGVGPPATKKNKKIRHPLACFFHSVQRGDVVFKVALRLTPLKIVSYVTTCFHR